MFNEAQYGTEDGREGNLEGHPRGASFMFFQNVIKLWAENYNLWILKQVKFYKTCKDAQILT